MSSAFTDLTIVIPTYNREQTLRRSISYWESLGIRVLVLDGSDLPIFQDGPVSSDSIVSYFSFPRNESENLKFGSYFRRMRFAATQVSSKFVALCADDDYFLASGIQKALQLLDEQPWIDAVFRPCADYRISEEGVYWNLEYSEWSDRGFGASADVQTRVRKTDRGYINYYSICRVEKWKHLLELCFEIEFGHSQVIQFLMDEIGKILFRTAVLDDLLYIRQYNNPLKYQSDEIGLGRWLIDDKNIFDVTRIKDQIRKALLTVEETYRNDEIVDSILDFHASAFRDFWNRATAKSLKHLRWVPHFVRNGANRLIPRQMSFALGYRGKVLNENGLQLSDFKKYLEKNYVPFVADELDDLLEFLN